jgi:hypothetical protein
MIRKSNCGLMQPEYEAQRDFVAQSIHLWPVILLPMGIPNKWVVSVNKLNPTLNYLVYFFNEKFFLPFVHWPINLMVTSPITIA